MALASRLVQPGLEKVRFATLPFSNDQLAKSDSQLCTIAIGLIYSPTLGAERPDVIQVSGRERGEDQAARDP